MLDEIEIAKNLQTVEFVANTVVVKQVLRELKSLSAVSESFNRRLPFHLCS